MDGDARIEEFIESAVRSHKILHRIAHFHDARKIWGAYENSGPMPCGHIETIFGDRRRVAGACLENKVGIENAAFRKLAGCRWGLQRIEKQLEWRCDGRFSDNLYRNRRFMRQPEMELL